jgi:hypothetical protein
MSIMAIDKELDDYYSSRFEMMSSKGWKDFIEDVDNIIKQYNNVLSLNSAEEFHKRKGQLDILYWVLNLKQESEAAWKELNNEENF